MRSYLQALKEVSSLPIALEGRQKSATDAQRVIMRGLLGLLWGACGGLVCWLVAGDKVVGSILGTLAVFALRHAICPKDEKKAVPELSKLLLSGVNDSDMRSTYNSLVTLGLFLLRPFCTYVILVHGAWLWLPIAAVLGYTAALDCGVMTKLDQKHWLPAVVMALILGGISSKLMPECRSIFMLSVVSAVSCWLLPSALRRFNLRLSKNSALYACEAFALLLGIAALAI